MAIRIDASRSRISTEPMVGRVTAAPADRSFRVALGDGARVLLGGVEAAARALPGGEIVAAAVHGGARAAASGGAVVTAGPGGSASGLDPLAGSSNEAMQLIALQQQIQDENRRFTTLSNVMKARHETAKNAIGNLR